MIENLVAGMLWLVAAYAAAGLVFAVAFVSLGAPRVDSQAVGASFWFRLLIFPGAAAFWPLLLRIWLRAAGDPPEQENPHRAPGSNLRANAVEP